MNKLTLLIACLSLVGCSKKSSDGKADPAPAPKMAEPAKKEPVTKPALADVSVTSKSKEAIAAFEQGRELFDHARGGEAIANFQKAIELDPEFAQAHAYLGMVTPGAAGTDHLAKAGTLAAKVPDAERELISAYQAMRAGDVAKTTAGLDKVLQLAPGAWRADVMLGNIANNEGMSDGTAAIKRFEHALTIKPDLAIAQNGLAYAHAAQREWEPAIAAAKKQVEMMPKEPNPQDTLGEILLWSSKFDESEKAFQAAIAVEPKFTLAWQGVGLARAYRGDYKGAYEAYEKQKASANAADRLEPYLAMAWIAMAEDKPADAIGYLDALEKDPTTKDLPIFAFAAIERGNMLALTGKYPEAATSFAAALTRSEGLAGDGRNNLIRTHAISVLRAAVLSGKASPDADKLVAAVEDQAKAAPDEPALQQVAAWARGLAAWAKTGAKDAVPELAKCNRNLVPCRFDLAQAQRKAGDAAAADATSKEISETPRRDEGVVYLRTHLAKK